MKNCDGFLVGLLWAPQKKPSQKNSSQKKTRHRKTRHKKTRHKKLVTKIKPVTKKSPYKIRFSKLRFFSLPNPHRGMISIFPGNFLLLFWETLEGTVWKKGEMLLIRVTRSSEEKFMGESERGRVFTFHKEIERGSGWGVVGRDDVFLVECGARVAVETYEREEEEDDKFLEELEL